MEIKFELSSSEYKDLTGYCKLNNLNPDLITKKSYLEGFRIEKYGLLSGSGGTVEKEVIKEVIKYVEVPVVEEKEVIKIEYIDVEKQMSNKFYRDEKKLVAGFGTTVKTRPLIISTLDTYINGKDILIRSQRLIDELFTFIWSGGRAEAMKGYNDDLTMALAIGLWVRNTALRLRQEGIDLTKSMLNASQINQYEGFVSTGYLSKNPYEMELGKGEIENLTWLLK